MAVIRADERVSLTSEGAALFPSQAGIVGAVLGYNSPTDARVLFDGLVTPIVVHRRYLELATPRSRNIQRNGEVVARRKLIRAAFDVVRRAPREKSTAKMLAGALGGRIEITQSILDASRIIVSEVAATPTHKE